MTIEEKREKINKFCNTTDCNICPLHGETWDHYLNDTLKYCLHIHLATEEELDRALNLIEEFYNNSPVNTRVSCGAEIPEGRQVCPTCENNYNKEPTGDPIKPEYYNDTKITPFDVIDDWGLNFYLGNAVKYIKRAGKKADNSRLQDLKKIREYIDHEIRAEEVER